MTRRRFITGRPGRRITTHGYLYPPDLARSLQTYVDAIGAIRVGAWHPREHAALTEALRLIEAARVQLKQAKHCNAFWKVPEM